MFVATLANQIHTEPVKMHSILICMGLVSPGFEGRSSISRSWWVPLRIGLLLLHSRSGQSNLPYHDVSFQGCRLRTSSRECLRCFGHGGQHLLGHGSKHGLQYYGQHPAAKSLNCARPSEPTCRLQRSKLRDDLILQTFGEGQVLPQISLPQLDQILQSRRRCATLVEYLAQSL